MNLELLDPFRRQIPDRVDATLTLPTNFHKKASAASASTSPRAVQDSPEPTASEGKSQQIRQPQEEALLDDQEWKSAYHVGFNRRGTYLAVGHASGTVAVHDFLSRTLSAVYRPEEPEQPEAGATAGSAANETEATSPSIASTTDAASAYPHGVTSVTWSRRSRTLLAGASGDTRIRLVDTTHPMGPEECVSIAPDALDHVVGTTSTINAAASGEGTNSTSQEPTPVSNSLFTPESPNVELMKVARSLDVLDLSVDDEKYHTAKKKYNVYEKALKTMQQEADKDSKEKPKRYPMILFSLPLAVGGSLQIHPRHIFSGLAVLSDGSLVIFQAPSDCFVAHPGLAPKRSPLVKVATLWNGRTGKHSITCAAFDPHGERLFAATKDGVLMGFDTTGMLESLTSKTKVLPPVQPDFLIPIPGSATAWHLLVSRNGRFLLLNCADSALRVYNAKDCWKSPSKAKPKVFQDVVSKVPFASCDFSGDAEYLVGGCNRNDKYDLYLWNATTGALMDRLTGPQVSLHSVAWHPTRSFVAVATSDGVVDIWGPRMDWTAFAPDFQALPMNVEYVEEEDEFDTVDSKADETEEEEDADVDVATVEPVPVFASDSESESEVFCFETKIANIMAGRGRNSAAVGWAGRSAAEEKD